MADGSTDKKRPFDTFLTRVEKVEILSPRNKNIRFQYLEGKKMHFQAGQFVQIFVPQPDKPRRTSYSIASSPTHKGYFELCVTLVDGGVSSTFLHNLKVGDTVQSLGPLGKFTLPQPLPRDVVFIATGSGIAPFRSMINYLLEMGTERRVSLLFGNRFAEDVLYREEWEALVKKNHNFKSFFTLSRGGAGWSGSVGYVQDKITEAFPDLSNKDFYICGLVKMIDGVVEKLKSQGVLDENIHFERYD